MAHIDDIKNGKREVGKVTSEERDEIRKLFERKNGLAELFKSLADIEENEQNRLYDKIVADMGKVATEYKNWWREKSRKYNWNEIEGYHWEIDFNTCEIFLVKKN